MKAMLLAGLLFATLSLAVAPAVVAADNRDPSALRGLGLRLCVLVEEPNADAKKAGVSEEKVRAAVAEDLKKARFDVVTAGAPCLRVAVRTHALAGTGLASHYVELALVEEVSPARDPALHVQAATWRYGTVGTSLGARLEAAVMATATGSVALFVDDYQLVNAEK